MNNNNTTNDEQCIWVIKDQDGVFARKSSIGRSEGHKWIYIGFRTFSEECRGDTFKDNAEKALIILNRVRDKAEFDMTFHLEYVDLNKINKDNREYLGDNMVVVEKEFAIKGLSKAV